MKNIIGLLVMAALLAACKKGGSGGSDGGAPVPTAATLLTPLKDAICATGTSVSDSTSSIAFTWKGGNNTNSYDVTITNLLSQVATTQSSTGSQLSVTLKKNTPYSWFITSKSTKTKNTAKSDIWKFYNAGDGIITYAPYPAEITSPKIGQQVSSTAGKVNLTWKGSAPDGAKIIGYSVYFGPSTNPQLFRTALKDAFINDVAVSANTTYYWHVVTVDSNNNVSDSGMYNFFVTQ